MADKSAIQWTEASWNPWHGCVKVSPGCKFCYMYRDKERYGQNPRIVSRSKSTFQDPLKWPEPKLIFTCSWSDWFIEDADKWRDEAWAIIRICPQHTFQILTKRPERIAAHLPADWGDGYPNVWLGVSCENQSTVDRIRILSGTAAQTRFISFEPLIGELTENFVYANIDWIIVGGESGNETGPYQYRPSALAWYENIISEYRLLSPPTKIFVKQLGTFLSHQLGLKDRHGGDIAEFPENLRIREFPNR